MSRARNMMETMRSPGWADYRKTVEEQIAQRRKDINELETEKMSIEEVGTFYLKLSHEIVGLQTALNISEIIRNIDEL